MKNVTRSQDEIIARMSATGDDYFVFRSEVLVGALDYEHAKPYLKPEVTAEEWAPSEAEDALASAASYLAFAIGKIDGHRGISASRSVDKLTEYAWLLGRDDVVEAMGVADYENYGAPKVKAFAVGLGLPWPTDNAELERMANGLPCVDDCDGGCGQ